MFEHVARPLLVLMGKEHGDTDPQGIFTAEQLPAAIERLKAALLAARSDAAGQRPENPEDELPIGLAQRIPPLLELFELAQQYGKPVLFRQG